MAISSGKYAKFAVIYGGQAFGMSYDVEKLLTVNGATGLRGVVFKGINNHRGYKSSPKNHPLNGLASGMDMNGDGNDDLAIADAQNNKVYVLFGGQKWVGN